MLDDQLRIKRKRANRKKTEKNVEIQFRQIEQGRNFVSNNKFQRLNRCFSSYENVDNAIFNVRQETDTCSDIKNTTSIEEFEDVQHHAGKEKD